MADDRIRPYASASARGTVAAAAIVIVAALDAVLAYAYALDLRVLRASPEAAHLAELALTSLETPFVLVDGARFSGLLMAAVLFLAWVHRAYGNLPALGAARLEHSPAVAVGSFLVPVVNLVVPFSVMAELRARSASLAGSGSGGAGLPGVWWVAFVVSCAARTYLVELFGRVDPPVGRWRAATELALGAQFASVAAAVCVVALIREIDRSQRARFAALPGVEGGRAPSASARPWVGCVGWLASATVVAIALVLGAVSTYAELHGAKLGESARPGPRVEAGWRATLESAGLPGADERLLWFDRAAVPRVDGHLGFALTDRRVVVLRVAEGRSLAPPESLALDEIRRAHIAWTEKRGLRTIVALGRDPAEEPEELRLFLSPDLGGDHAFLEALAARLPADAVVTSNVPDLS